MAKLTDVERLILANQYTILSKLEPNDETHAHCAEVLMRGYEGLYGRLIFQYLSEPRPASMSDEVQEIFEMYRSLTDGYAHHSVKKPKGGYPTFEGFDGNNDDEHGIGHFLVHDLGLWQELKNGPMDSHSSGNLPAYRRMLAVWRDLGKPYPATQAQADKIVGAFGR